jgi:hypothetical protein
MKNPGVDSRAESKVMLLYAGVLVGKRSWSVLRPVGSALLDQLVGSAVLQEAPNQVKVVAKAGVAERMAAVGRGRVLRWGAVMVAP